MPAYAPSAIKRHIENHQRHIRDGYCSSVKDKTWCNERAGHTGKHRAPYLMPDSTKVRSVYWEGSERCPCHDYDKLKPKGS